MGRTGQQLAAELGASLATDAIAARFNVAPSQPAPMMVALPDRRIGLATFGWTLRGKKGLLLNARSETAPANGLFRSALERRRALIPADGFYEWRATEGEGKGSKKAPRDAFFLHQRGELITFAGLYYVEKVAGEASESESEPLKKKASFVILTTAASDDVAPVHDRMPIIVPPELRSAWLDPTQSPDELLEKLTALRPEIELRQVGSKVGSPANDDPSLQDPVDGTKTPAA